MKLFLILLFFCFNSFFTYGQSKEEAVERLISDFARTLETKPDSALYYINKAIHNSKKLNNKFMLSRSLYNKGYFFYINNNTGKAKQFFFESIIPAKESLNYKILSMSYNQIGLIYMNNSEYNNSLKMFLNSLKVTKKHNLSQKEFDVLNNLGLLYENQGDTLKAFESYFESEKIALKENFLEDLFHTYNNIAILKRKSNKKEAIAYYKKALKLSEKTNVDYNKFIVYINLSDIYLSFDDISFYKNSLFYLNEANKLTEITKDNKNMFFLKFNLASYYYKIKHYKKAIDVYTEALSLIKDGIDNNQIIKLYGALAEIYKANNDFEKALYYQKKYNEENNKVFNIEKNKVFNEIQTKYEVEKKNLKIDLLTKEKEIEKEKKKITIFIGIILLILLSSTLFFFIHRNKTQKLINEKENKFHQQEIKRLEQEKELKKVLGLVEGQDNERNRLAKEIHDGVASNLAGIKLHLSQANRKLKNQTIESVIEQVSKTFHELRNISHDLSLNYIQERNLRILLEELKKEHETRMSFNVEINVFPEEKIIAISKKIKHDLYRIIQELLTNVSKHAEAKNISINITLYEDYLNLIFEDDGKGFYNIKNKGIGLLNIQERLLAINGEIRIENMQKGAVVIINIPNYNDG